MSSPIRMKAGDAWPAARAQIVRDGQGMQLPPEVSVTLRIWREGDEDVAEYEAEVEDPEADPGDQAGFVRYRWGVNEPIDPSLVVEPITFLYQFVTHVPGIGTFTAPTVGADYLIVYPREI
jgi:hypothetical protein